MSRVDVDLARCCPPPAQIERRPAATPSITPSLRHCCDKLRQKAARFPHGAAPAAFLMTDGGSEDCKIRETRQDPGGGAGVEGTLSSGRLDVQVKLNTENKSRGDSLNCSNSWMKFNMTSWEKSFYGLKIHKALVPKLYRFILFFLFHK